MMISFLKEMLLKEAFLSLFAPGKFFRFKFTFTLTPWARGSGAPVVAGLGGLIPDLPAPNHPTPRSS